jgi:CHAT domain-containing protein
VDPFTPTEEEDRADELEHTGAFSPVAAPLEEASPPPSPPRYTDVTVLDPDQGVHALFEPFVASTTYFLEVAIRGERRGLTMDRADQPAIHMPRQVDTISVWAVISDETEGEVRIAQELFTFVDGRFAEIKLPPAGDSVNSALFKFTARPDRIALNGPHAELCPRIGIRLYHKLNLIDHLQLDLRFEEAAGGAPSTTQHPAVRVVFKHPSGETAAIEPPNPSSARRALTISISKEDTPANRYRFAIAAGSKERPEVPVLSGTKKLSEDELNDFVARFREMLLPTVFGAALGQVSLPDKDRDELLKSLSLLGSEIVTRLFDFSPGGDFFELGAMVRDALPDMSIIQISLSEDAKDFVFPWQTLTVKPNSDPDAAVDPSNLWGYRFIIEVKRRGDGVDHRREASLSPGAARMTYARWHFKNEPQHYAALAALAAQAKIPVQWIAPVIESRADFIAALTRGGGDLVYVYAHGHAAAPNTPLGTKYRDNAQQQIKAVAQRMKSNPLQQSMTQNQGWMDLEEQFLKLTRAGAESSLTLSKSEVGLTSLLIEIGGSRRRLTDAPIVFLNTCESAQIWNAVAGSFVGFFLDRGARAVVGTESTIPIVLADAFGRETLMHLFAGDSLGEAVLKARLALLQSSKNPLGLCYCIYGAADTRLGPHPLAA